MDCLAAHDREGYARHFIGERDGDITISQFEM